MNAVEQPSTTPVELRCGVRVVMRCGVRVVVKGKHGGSRRDGRMEVKVRGCVQKRKMKIKSRRM